MNNIIIIILIFLLCFIMIFLFLYIIFLKEKIRVFKIINIFDSNIKDVNIKFIKENYIENNELYIKPFVNEYEIIKLIALFKSNNELDYIDNLSNMINYNLLNNDNFI